MKFQFKTQGFQLDAVQAVVDVFAGQQNAGTAKYTRDVGKLKSKISLAEYDPEFEIGYRNADVTLKSNELLKNIHAVQTRNNLKYSSDLADGLGAVSLDVEMETGTGKTYCYINTMFELYKTYGWGKFIVVVPSIAIREGVRKSFEMTLEHFFAERNYGVKARFFMYNSSNLHQLDEFSQNAGINVMIINTQAFNTTMNEDKSVAGRSGNEAARIIYTKRDEFGSRRPIDVIKANRPIIILDEPQKMEGKATQAALKKNFAPLFSLNYSATHKTTHNPVYVLDALDAFKKKLVKKIEVKGFEVKHLSGTHGYMYLAAIVLDKREKGKSAKPPRARLEIEVKRKSGIKHETRLFDVNDSLFAASNELEEYRNISIEGIDPVRAVVTFSNGAELKAGEAFGNLNDDDIRRIQIRETITSHLEKEEQLFNDDIKCLSLFFIDEVRKYRQYDGDEKKLGDYGRVFEDEYNAAVDAFLTLDKRETAYGKYLLGISAGDTHKGYFSVDKKGVAKNSEVKRGSDISDDVSAYELILKRKEQLLSFDEPTRFIFSHSALREGWDNPNVFQICTLKHSDSAVAKRQEVGRGLRLCVNDAGERQDEDVCGVEAVHGINKLTVIASESYAAFVGDLQKEIKTDLYDRPVKATIDYFKGRVVKDGEHEVTDNEATAIYNYLVKNDYINDDGFVTDAYRNAAANGKLADLKDELKPFTDDIHKFVQAIFDPQILENIVIDGHETKVKDNPINDNWADFQDLWSRINKRYAYTCDFNSASLITNAAKAINEKLNVAKLSYSLTVGEQTEVGTDFKTAKAREKKLDKSSGSSAAYDIIGKIAEGTTLTRHTIAGILKAVSMEKKKLFTANPEGFINKVVKLINGQKAAVIVEHVTYAPSAEEPYTQDIFNMSRTTDEYAKAFRAKHAIQDYVFTDGISAESVERTFVESLDTHADGDDSEVIVYAKLPRGPRGFYIPTPVGNYSPDWAISFRKDKVKHIFFIAETKGSMDDLDLRKIEEAKIDCAKKLFNEINTDGVKYHEVDSYSNLLAVMETL